MNVGGVQVVHKEVFLWRGGLHGECLDGVEYAPHN